MAYNRNRPSPPLSSRLLRPLLSPVTHLLLSMAERPGARKSLWDTLCRELQCLSQQHWLPQKDQEGYAQHLTGSASIQ